MPDVVIENPIINSPYSVPTRHWRFNDDGITNEIEEGRRKSAYFMPIPASQPRAGAQQEMEFAEWTQDRIEETRFVNDLRQELDKWRFAHWPGTTATTRSLLEYWTDPERSTHLYFCQVEATGPALTTVDPSTMRHCPLLQADGRMEMQAN